MANSTGHFQISATNPDYQQATTFGKGLLPWQKDAFKAVRGARFSFVVAFMGSGKSYVQLTLGADEIIKSKYTQKQLVIVPQSHIHKGFVKETLHLNGREIQWEVGADQIFLGELTKDVKNKLKAWLLSSGNDLYKAAGGRPSHLKGLTAVTSHSSLGMVFKDLTPAQKNLAIHNLTLRIDEAHHINNIMDIVELGLSAKDIRDLEGEANNLSLICSYIMKSKDETAHLSLTTATPFRGDQSDIIKKGAKARFSTYYLPFFDHWRSLGIKDFGLEYLMYESNPVKMCLKRILAEPKELHMVIVPTSTRKWRVTGEEHLELIAALEKAFPGQVLDLVDQNPAARSRAKLRLFDEPRKPQDKPSKVRVIVTCMVGREGTDWCPCSRIHNMSLESTLTLAVQTLGRPFRRFFPVKTEVRCFNYVPMFEVPDENKTVKDVLSNRTNALLTCMMMDEGFHPILLPKLPEYPRAEGEKGATLESVLRSWDVDYEDFKAVLLDVVETDPDLAYGKRTAVAVKEAVTGVLEEFGISGADLEYILPGAMRFLARTWFAGHREKGEEVAKVNGVDVSLLLDQGYDKLIEFLDDRDKSLVFTGAFAERDLLELKEMFKMSFDDNFSILLAGLASREG
jgi:hypothetical protein